MLRVEGRLDEHDIALRGGYNGKPGVLAALQHLAEQSTLHTQQLDSLRLDRAKVVGIVLAVSVIWGVIYKVILK